MQNIYILGNGTMAKALACGLRDRYNITIVGRDEAKLQHLKEQNFQTLHYSKLDIQDKNIILAFKPYALKELASLFKNQARLLISVLANTSIEELQIIKAQNYARIMPNTAAKYKASSTPFVLKNSAFKDEIIDILNHFGTSYELNDEKLMNAATAISGCAPAFLALVAESIANAGVYEGLDKNLSLKLTQGLFQSFNALFTNNHPAIIKEDICSPAGITIKGVKILEEEGLRGTFFKALHASANK
ncbi:pyrroline-5-carboxylate reductase [Campylobacter sp. US33a]|nr:pyrroline-5-carboxylate reductase [Campylobacter sp. US33a]